MHDHVRIKVQQVNFILPSLRSECWKEVRESSIVQKCLWNPQQRSQRENFRFDDRNPATLMTQNSVKTCQMFIETDLTGASDTVDEF